MDASDMGRLVVDAIKDDTCFLSTQRDVYDIMRRRADDVDAFLSAPIATLGAR